MSAEPVAPSLYDGFTLPSWATPCETGELCEVDGLPIVASMSTTVVPAGLQGKRRGSNKADMMLCARCLAFERYNRREISWSDANAIAESLESARVHVKPRVTHINRPVKSKHAKK